MRWGSATLSSIERLSFSQWLKCTMYCYGKGAQKIILCREVVPPSGVLYPTILHSVTILHK